MLFRVGLFYALMLHRCNDICDASYGAAAMYLGPGIERKGYPKDGSRKHVGDVSLQPSSLSLGFLKLSVCICLEREVCLSNRTSQKLISSLPKGFYLQ